MLDLCLMVMLYLKQIGRATKQKPKKEKEK